MKVNKNIKITAFEKKKSIRYRVGPDPALARPSWPGVKPTWGQGQAEGGPARPLDSVPGYVVYLTGNLTSVWTFHRWQFLKSDSSFISFEIDSSVNSVKGHHEQW